MEYACVHMGIEVIEVIQQIRVVYKLNNVFRILMLRFNKEVVLMVIKMGVLLLLYKNVTNLLLLEMTGKIVNMLMTLMIVTSIIIQSIINIKINSPAHLEER